jgi:hypothetical protein
MRTETRKFRRVVLAFALVLASFAGMVQPARAGDEEKPAVNGKNSKIQLSGTGWVVYRYMLADESKASAPKGVLSKDGTSRKDANSFDIDRVQVTGDYMFNDRLTWRTVLEGDNLGGVARLYIKNGFFRVKDPWGLKSTAFKFGLYAHGMTSTLDDFWGYRVISENSLNRYLGIGSAYAGVGMDTKLAKGAVDLDLGIANELGYNKAVTVASKDESNRSKYKTFTGRLILTPPVADPLLKSFHLALFGQINGKNPVSQSDTKYLPAEALPKSASDNRNLWFEVFPHFKSGKLAAGFEFVMASNKYTRQLAPTPDPADTTGTRKISHELEKKEVKSRYLGGVVTYQILPSVGCFARLDVYDPDSDHDASWTGTESAPKDLKGLKVTNLLAGVSRAMAPGVRSIVDVEYTKFENPKNVASGAELKLHSDVTISARMELKL